MKHFFCGTNVRHGANCGMRLVGFCFFLLLRVPVSVWPEKVVPLSPYGNISSAFISILLNANSFFPKSLRDAPR